MIQETPQADLFKQQMRESLRQETLNSRAVTIAKHDNVYTCGDNDEMVYFIESGQVKLLCYVKIIKKIIRQLQADFAQVRDAALPAL